MIVEKDKGGVVSRISFPIPSILKIQKAAIKDPSLRILPEYNAQGNKHQWVLPTSANETWKQLGTAYPELRQQVLARIEAAKQAFAAQQKGGDMKKIDAIFNTPDNNEFVYYRTEFDGSLSAVAIAGWGFRYPDHAQKKGVTLADEGANIQKVEIDFVDEGRPVADREFKYGLVSNSKTKMGKTDREGKCPVGNFTLGLEFFVFDPLTAKNFTFTVTKGQDKYVCDVTVEKPVEQPPLPPGSNPDNDPEEGSENNPEGHEGDEGPSGSSDNGDITGDDHPKQTVAAKLRVEDRNGKVVALFPVFIDYGGRKTRIFSDKDGLIALPQMVEDETFSVTDGFMDNNRQDYLVSADTDTYVYRLDYTLRSGNRDITVRIIDEKEKPICKDYVILQSGAHLLRCIPDEKGQIYLDNNDFERNVPLKFTLVRGQEELYADDFMLVPGEQEYTVQVDTHPCPLWKRLLEVAAMIISFVGIMYLFALVVDICSMIA